KEGIILTSAHPLHNSPIERAASLVHEIGATSRFKLTHQENTSRENDLRKNWDKFITPRTTVYAYVAELEHLFRRGVIRKIEDPSRIRFDLNTERQQRYLKAMQDVLAEEGKSVVNPEILFKAARRASEGDRSDIKGRISLQPGTMNPLHYGHISMSLAGILDQVTEADREVEVMSLLANGGTVPDKPYAANADIRNTMANLAVDEANFRDWIQVTPIRKQAVDMFESQGEVTLALAGTEAEAKRLEIKSVENLRRFNMDMAAFIYLFVANPNIEWVYLVGSDKVKEYGIKNEQGLIRDTLGNTDYHLKVVYFTRTGQEVKPAKDIKPFDWLKEKWDSGFFRESTVPSHPRLAAVQIRTALSGAKDLVRQCIIDKETGATLSDSIPEAVINYILDDSYEGKQLRYLYPLENREKDAEGQYKLGLRQRALLVYEEILAVVEAERTKPEASRQADAEVLGTVIKNLKKTIAKIRAEIEILDFNAALVQSADFIADLNSLLAIFGKPELALKYYPTARALAYEAERRLSSREEAVRFRRDKRPEYGEGVSDPENDRYNRILEGVVQILNRHDYDPYVLINRWGYSNKEMKEIIEQVTEEFTHLFFASIVKAIRLKIAHTGHPANAPPEAIAVLDRVVLLSEADIEAMNAKALAEEFIEPLVNTEAGLGIFTGMQEKFFLYSAGPGTGKGEIMDATFTTDQGRYADLIAKLILYHTRTPRVKDGKCEKDGVDYHFRTEEELRRLEAEYGVETAWVNRQLQGLASYDFDETMTIPRTDLVPDRKGIQLTEENAVVPDTVIPDTSEYLTVRRRIRGSQAVFDGKKPVILEGGYDWFLKLHARYPGITVAFISPFSDDEIDKRTRNTEWIERTFRHPVQIRIAYEEMNRLIIENKGEIDIAANAQYQERIQAEVREFSRVVLPLATQIEVLIAQQIEAKVAIPFNSDGELAAYYDTVNRGGYKVQVNPRRHPANRAVLEKGKLGCFLCPENMPRAEVGIAWSRDWTFYVNPNPYEKNHIVLVKNRTFEHHPFQVINHRTDIEAAIEFIWQLSMVEGRSNFNLTFNTQGAAASSRHFHYQAFEARLPIVDRETVLLDMDGVRVGFVKKYRAKVIVVEGNDKVTVTEKVWQIVDRLSTAMPGNFIPYNLLFKVTPEGLIKVFIFPRNYEDPSNYNFGKIGEQRKDLLATKFGICEMSGLFIVYQSDSETREGLFEVHETKEVRKLTRQNIEDSLQAASFGDIAFLMNVILGFNKAQIMGFMLRLGWGIQGIFDFLFKRDALMHADVMIVFGNYDTRIAEEAARLAGLADYIVVCGYKGIFTQHFTEPEAVVFKRVLIEKGVPENKIIVEAESTNTKLNLDNVFALLEARGIKYNTAILVAHPLHQLRAAATTRRYYPAVKIMNHAAYTLDVNTMDVAELRWMLQYALRDIRKIKESVEKDWIVLTKEELSILSQIEDFTGALTKENTEVKIEELIQVFSGDSAASDSERVLSLSSSTLRIFQYAHRLIGAVVRTGHTPAGLQVVTNAVDPLGLKVFVRKKGTKGDRELHTPSISPVPFGTRPRQEVLHVLEGKIECTFYTKDNELVGRQVLSQGDTVLFTEAHQVFFLEDSVILEIAQGPYPGTREKDKIILDTPDKEELSVGEMDDSDPDAVTFKKDGRLIGTVVRADHMPKGTVRFANMQDPISFNSFARTAGAKGTRAYHTSIEGLNPFGARPRQEALFVLKGKAKAYFYTTENVPVAEEIVNAGDMVMFTEGHVLEFLEDTVILEVKQGPYPQTKEKDMVILPEEKQGLIDVVDIASLEKAYNSIWEGATAMVEKGEAPKPLENHKEYDVSLIATAPDFPVELSDRLYAIAEDLKRIFPGLALTPKELIHMTIFVFVTGLPLERIQDAQYGFSEEMAEHAKKALEGIGPIVLKIKGINMGTKGTIFAEVHVDDNRIFELHRRLSGLYPNEHRLSRVLNISLARISEAITPEQFRELYNQVAKLRNVHFGEVVINNPLLLEVNDRWGFNQSKQITIALNFTDKSDPARPIPGQPMPSRRKVNASVKNVGWDNTQAVDIVDIESIEVRLASDYLRSIGREDMAEYLEYLAKAGLIRAGPFEGFLASTYRITRRKEGIILTSAHPLHNSPIERAASLVHEIGATSRFKLTHQENNQRETNFKKSFKGKATKEAYLKQLYLLEQQGDIHNISASSLRLEMNEKDMELYLAVIEKVLNEQGIAQITPAILFEAARRSLAGRISTLRARIALQPGTMNPLTYGHITAALAAIIDQRLDRVILANGGTVPDKPYAASADIRNEMANIAVQDRGLSDWLLISPVRAQTVGMFECNLAFAGNNEAERRFNMDMAAFIWLFTANPNAEWFYIVGADKLAEYGKKNEV
ncbi:MAG: DUF4922 domain-containing protein, partial [Candidatus Omnitrophota bacterium]